MKRQVVLEEISDGRLYTSNDMVRADCDGCQGCHACCMNMDKSIILDPWDMKQITEQCGVAFEVLLQDKIELNVVDGVILPNLRMNESNQCAFLNSDGRCSIHGSRPGVCRLFPLGRYYENHDFKYFLQIYECKKENRGKVKVHKWLDIPDLKRYEKFVLDWHYFLNAVEAMVQSADDDTAKKIDVYILQVFYLAPYSTEDDFYKIFDQRLEVAKAALSIKQ